ncbi:tRNA (adenosine(37)-N6)-dimethylallyltransferase MiaA [Mariniphaga sp.]|uniref:tRNA (adenosine(37)-N6)-dimethylallyltransferase MiaA n=1 Tax=Mariniphaga sp. TaxID=1954475 RepID=UPI00356607A4
MTKHLIIITGPTAIGKTRVAIETAKFFNTEIVSADSRQIYRELSIGTAVPSQAELNSITHHFIRSHSIHDAYNASRYESEAMELLEKLFRKYNTVVLTGGSMLYIDAVCKGIDIMPDVDPELRQNLKTSLKENGIEGLRFQLKQLDPAYYNQVDLKNPARIVHALEICLMTGKPYSSFRTSPSKERPFSVIKIGLDCDRVELHQRINQRVDKMIEAGLEEEARSVYPFKHLNSLNTVGYREFFAHFNGEISKEKTIELIKRNSRRYARKQLTWFRKDSEMNWFQPHDLEKIIKFIKNKIEKK